MGPQPNVASTAFLIADPARAAMLTSLLDGRARPAGELAFAAGVTAPTASSHLGKLLAGGLLLLETQGRHRYYRLAGPHVALTLETLAAISPLGAPRRKAQSREAQSLRFARCCYDHLAGRVGVAVTTGLQERGFLVAAADKQYDVTQAGIAWFGSRGIDVGALKPGRRGACPPMPRLDGAGTPPRRSPRRALHALALRKRLAAALEVDASRRGHAEGLGGVAAGARCRPERHAANRVTITLGGSPAFQPGRGRSHRFPASRKEEQCNEVLAPMNDGDGEPAERPDEAAGLDGLSRFGLMAGQTIRRMVARGLIEAPLPIEDAQYQPASLDLRLGPRAYRVRASFLPGRERSVGDQLVRSQLDELSLEGRGAVLERGCVYVVPLLEGLRLPADISATANPKSSTGRLDIFTRLITDRSEVFDQVASGYQGGLFAEISPRSFSTRVRQGSKLNQIRFRRHRNPAADPVLADRDLLASHQKTRLVDGTLNLRGGLLLSVGLVPAADGIVGYRAQKHTDILDVDCVNAYEMGDFWEPLRLRADRRLILDPGEFYILASRERICIPADLAAEMVPIDPAMGEFRVHYAGFFDPGFGLTPGGQPGSRAVLEVRSHEVPFLLEHGQVIGRLAFERMAEPPDVLYGQGETSNYQGQGLKLSKHFRTP
jgi:dCTP deaminase